MGEKAGTENRDFIKKNDIHWNVQRYGRDYIYHYVPKNIALEVAEKADNLQWQLEQLQLSYNGLVAANAELNKELKEQAEVTARALNNNHEMILKAEHERDKLKEEYEKMENKFLNIYDARRDQFAMAALTGLLTRTTFSADERTIERAFDLANDCMRLR